MMSTVVRAVVLAAGASSRMGSPKAALPLTDRADTFLLRILRTCVAAGLPDIVVVTGAAPDVVRHAAGVTGRHVRFVHNAQWASGQLSSLLTGLEERGGERLEAALMTLVDVPFVSAYTVSRVVDVWRGSRAPIVRPARGNQHGHPVIFDRSLFHELRAADPRVGAKPVVRAHEREIINVEVDDPGAFLDIDNVAEYRKALTEMSAKRAPA